MLPGMKEMYNDSSVDMTRILQQHATGDLQDWAIRQEAVKAVVAKALDFFRGLMPEDKEQKLLLELEKLRAENIRLMKSQTAEPEPDTENLRPSTQS